MTAASTAHPPKSTTMPAMPSASLSPGGISPRRRPRAAWRRPRTRAGASIGLAPSAATTGRPIRSGPGSASGTACDAASDISVIAC